MATPHKIAGMDEASAEFRKFRNLEDYPGLVTTDFPACNGTRSHGHIDRQD